MYITEINIKNFRNLSEQKITLNSRINVLYGDNAQGKTSFIEAIYFCANGRSVRSSKDSEMIMWEKNDAHIQLYLTKNNINDRIDVHLKAEGTKGVAVNGLPIKRLGDLMQNIFVVIFSPEDLSLIKGGPGERRRFTDVQLCRLSNVYYYDLQQYYKVLKQRNMLLKDIARKKAQKEDLFVWDEQLAAFGKRIISSREAYIRRLDAIASKIHLEISGHEKLELTYKPSVSCGDFLARLTKTIDKDIVFGSTSVGIHKDDVLFTIDGKDARAYASQGQQRTASLSAVLAEVELIREDKCEDPILLLDDVLSELDEKRRTYLFRLIGSMQTIITCTGIDELLDRLKGSDSGAKVKMFHVKNGVLE